MTIDLSKLLSLKTPASGAAKVGESPPRSHQKLIMGSDTFAKGVGHHASA